jgi:KaiC/GvpD/RAD55 family RecA-like ATPase
VTDFRRLTETLAKFLVARPEFMDFMLSIGVDVADWPEGRPRRIAETYLSLREKENHDYAVHVLAQDARTLQADLSVPLDPGALRVIYRQAEKTYRTKLLADRLSIAEPAEYDSLIAQYQSAQTRGVKLFSLAEQFKPILESNERARAEGRAIVKIPGWDSLSEAIGGFNPGRVSLLVADTGFGKTNLSANLARAAAKVGPVIFINMEMMAQDLGEKFLLGATRTSFGQFKQGQVNPDRILGAQRELTGRRLLYTDGRTLSVQEIFALARQEKNQHGLFMLFIDYDQKLRLSLGRTEEWKALQIAVEQLEELAKELSIYVLLMSQSNEEGNPSGSRRMKHAASTVLRFHSPEGKTVIQAIKNRFGRHNAAVEVNYEADKAFVEEVGLADVETFASPKKPSLRLS